MFSMSKFFKALGVMIAVIFCLAIIAVLGGLFYFKSELSAVNKSSKENVTIEVKEGDTYYSIAPKLKENKLIKSEKVYRLYIKLNPPATNLKVGKYELSSSMDTKTIVEKLQGRAKTEDILVTFKEGKNMRYYAKVIADNTNNTEEDVFNKLKDKEYLNKLIKQYWFIDKSILNQNIYYPLEGYLYPETYRFKSKDVTVEEIFKILLDQTEKEIQPYKKEILASKYSFHEILSLASVVELEAKEPNDRINVAAVFYNRLKSNMSLGSDVTTYYAAKVDMSERDLYAAELNAVNSYNTRSSTMAGKLPVGPICNPSISSIVAALNPGKNNYYFFVADKNGDVYFTKTLVEHNAKIAELKRKGLWFTY